MIIIKKSEDPDTFKLDGKKAKQESKESSNPSMLSNLVKLVLESLVNLNNLFFFFQFFIRSSLIYLEKELIVTEYRKDSFNQELVSFKIHI